ncbi:MAG: phage major capsid protein [Mycolicibacterium vanbaalenii]|uniref:phage major capsid protein n=1 Tax=Mycolicibacterium vanbaalenii TaxID=110539 RepID=UPI003562B97F
MSLLTTNAGGILRPEEVGALIVQPVAKASVAMQVGTIVETNSKDFRIPIVTDDVSASWTAEGADITATDAEVDELLVTPKKIAALSKVSRELAADSSPAAQNVVGQSIARDIARRVDSAFFGDTVANGPDGISSLNDIQFVDADTITNVDPFSEAISKAENEGAQITAFIANAATVLALSKLKKLTTGSNEPLLQPDPTLPTRRQILGVPLYSVPNTVVPANTVWAVDISRVFVVVRQDVELSVDESFYFGSDSLAVRAVMRVAFGFPHERAVIKIAPEPGT